MHKILKAGVGMQPVEDWLHSQNSDLNTGSTTAAPDSATILDEVRCCSA